MHSPCAGLSTFIVFSCLHKIKQARLRPLLRRRRYPAAAGRCEAECRALAARTAKPEHKCMLEGMAETWEQLAQQREALLARRARIAAIESENRGRSVSLENEQNGT